MATSFQVERAKLIENWLRKQEFPRDKASISRELKIPRATVATILNNASFVKLFMRDPISGSGWVTRNKVNGIARGGVEIDGIMYEEDPGLIEEAFGQQIESDSTPVIASPVGEKAKRQEYFAISDKHFDPEFMAEIGECLKPMIEGKSRKEIISILGKIFGHVAYMRNKLKEAEAKN